MPLEVKSHLRRAQRPFLFPNMPDRGGDRLHLDGVRELLRRPLLLVQNWLVNRALLWPNINSILDHRRMLLRHQFFIYRLLLILRLLELICPITAMNRLAQLVVYEGGGCVDHRFREGRGPVPPYHFRSPEAKRRLSYSRLCYLWPIELLNLLWSAHLIIYIAWIKLHGINQIKSSNHTFVEYFVDY